MRGPYIRVGVLALAGLALAVGAILFFSGNSISHGKFYETYFRDSVDGLNVGAPVKYRGVTIGAVTQIGLSSAEYGRGQPDDIRRATLRTVFVRFQIDPGDVGQLPTAETVDQAGLRARIAPQGLTGQSYVELDFFDPKQSPPLPIPWTPRYDYIPSVPSTFSQVRDAGTALLQKLQQVDVVGLANGLQGLVTDLRGSFQDGDAHRLIVQATAALVAAQAALAQADVPALSAQVQQTLGAVRGAAQGPQTMALLRNANIAVDRLGKAAAQLPPLIAALNAVAARANSTSADLEAGLAPLLRDTRATVSALQDTTDALRRDPSQVVFGGPPPRRADQ